MSDLRTLLLLSRTPHYHAKTEHLVCSRITANQTTVFPHTLEPLLPVAYVYRP